MRTTRTTAQPPKASAPASLSLAELEAALVRHIGRERYDLWFAQHTRLKPARDEIAIGVPSLHFQEWLSNRFGREVEAAVLEAAGRAMPIRFVIDPELFREARAKQEAAKPESARRKPDAFADEQPKYAEKPVQLYEVAEGKAAEEPRRGPGRPGRRWHKLDEFVVGPCNRVAFAASQSAAESPGQGPSPLVIHGPVGTGKTHLLEAVYVGLRQHAPNWRLAFVTAEDFTNRFVQSMRLGKQSQFRKQFRECDALLLDDLHFLARKKKTQEEFLHTFDALMADGKPIFLTCDCHPRLTDDFTPELADRLMGGAVWGLQPPDAATRLDLLRSKSARQNAAIAEEVLKFLASELRGNIRELEGALNSLRHFSRVTGRPIDIALAREALGDLLRHSVRVVRLADIDAAVCQVLQLPSGTLQRKARAWSISHPRMIAIFLARKHTPHSYGEVGAQFGGRNHSTAVAAEKKVREWLSADESLALNDRPRRVREVIDAVERILGR